MDNSGKIVYTKNSEVLTVNVAGTQGRPPLPDLKFDFIFGNFVYRRADTRWRQALCSRARNGHYRSLLTIAATFAKWKVCLEGRSESGH